MTDINQILNRYQTNIKQIYNRYITDVFTDIKQILKR